MAEDFADLKKKMARRYGQPPDEATDNMAAAPELEQPVPQRIDGRSLRRTGRTVGFSTKVTEDWDYRLKRYAARNNVLIVVALEQALDALEREEKARKTPD
jgi:hypothetical protein